MRWTSLTASPVLALAIAGCGTGPGGGAAGEERKSPFATGNVSVAPQVEGRVPAPTPVPVPLPPDAPPEDEAAVEPSP